MSAIGGIVCPNHTSFDPQVLFAMSRSLIPRGKDSRGAYVNRGIGIFQNRRSCEDPFSSLQPFTRVQNEKIYSVLLDGRIDGIDASALSCPIADSPELVLQAYLALGNACVSSLRGSFSLAICNEARGEVLLARDRGGSRPLYYIADSERLVFASEIKALLRSMDGAATVDLTRLRAHLLSPCGAYAGEALYRDVGSIPPAHCGLYSRFGMSIFAYEDASYAYEPHRNASVLAAPFVCPEKESLRQMLRDLLFAFDYPQFDHLMPAFLGALETLSDEQRSHSQPILIEDATIWMNLAYAAERADRLGRGFGVHAVSVEPNRWEIPKKALRRLEHLCAELLEEIDTEELFCLLGSEWREQLDREKSPIKRIRMQGMLYQTYLWKNHYPLRFV